MGQFIKGQSGNPSGRPLGSRNKLSEAFLDDLLSDWENHGKSVIVEVRNSNPSAYLKVVASLISKDHTIDLQSSGSWTSENEPEILAEIYARINEAFGEHV